MKKIADVPTGIFIMAAILFLQGFNYLLSAALGVFHSVPLAIVNLIIGAFSIVCASKLIRLQHQGWQLAIIASVLYLILALARIGLSITSNNGINDSILDAIIAAIILIYLNRPSIKGIFRR